MQCKDGRCQKIKSWMEANQQAEYTAKLLTGCGCLFLPLALIAIAFVLASLLAIQ